MPQYPPGMPAIVQHPDQWLHRPLQNIQFGSQKRYPKWSPTWNKIVGILDLPKFAPKVCPKTAPGRRPPVAASRRWRTPRSETLVQVWNSDGIWIKKNGAWKKTLRSVLKLEQEKNTLKAQQRVARWRFLSWKLCSPLTWPRETKLWMSNHLNPCDP